MATKKFKNNITETYPHYVQYLKDLKNGNVEISKSSVYEKYYGTNKSGTISRINKREWRVGEFGRQHWGVKMHGLSPYIGRMTPSMAYWLVYNSSCYGDIVLDPFGGVGTVALEASLLGRKPISVDISPYANLIASAKFLHESFEDEIDYLKSILVSDVGDVDISSVSPKAKLFFDIDTLKEIVYYGSRFVEDNKLFELACLMGILHGNRPGYLSGYTGCIIPMKLRTKSHPLYDPSRDVPIYRGVIPRLVGKMTRMFSDTLVNRPLDGKCLHKNSKKLSGVKSKIVDVIVSSPPYYDTLNYVDSNWLRLDILKACEYSMMDVIDVESDMTQHKNSYLDDMRQIGIELKRVLKTSGHIVFVLGDVHTTKGTINTAKEISEVYSNIGFNQLEIVNDEIPRNKCAVQRESHKIKFDRILIMEKE